MLRNTIEMVGTYQEEGKITQFQKCYWSRKPKDGGETENLGDNVWRARLRRNMASIDRTEEDAEDREL